MKILVLTIGFLFLSNAATALPFWNDTTLVNTNREFVGAARANDGAYPFTNNDWLSQFGVGDGNFSQFFVLTDPNSTPAGMAVPMIGILTGTQTAPGVTNSTPRALESIAVNNPAAGQSPSVWSYYLEAHNMSSHSGNTYGIELEIRNSGSAVTNWNPYSQAAAGTVGQEIGCGAGLSSAGQFPCTTAMYFASNPMSFAAGMLFLDGSIGAYGVNGSHPAIEMPHNYSIQWWKSGSITSQIYSDTTGNFHIDPAPWHTLVVGGEINVNGGIAAWTPSFTCQNGSGLTATVFGGTVYSRANGVAFVQAVFQITNTGTCSGALIISTPVSWVGAAVGTGIDLSNANQVQVFGGGLSGAGKLAVLAPNGASSIVNGHVYTISTSYPY